MKLTPEGKVWAGERVTLGRDGHRKPGGQVWRGKHSWGRGHGGHRVKTLWKRSPEGEREGTFRKEEEGQKSGFRGQEETVAKRGREVSERRLENVSLDW